MKLMPESICVLRLSALGDCINAFGLVNSIFKNYPSIKVRFVIDKRFASLFINDKGEQIVPMTCVDIKNKGLFKSILDLKHALKNDRFEMLFNLQTSLKASLLSLGIKAKFKYGYDRQRRREGQGLFINKAVKSPSNPHVLAGFMAFAHQAGLENLTPEWNYKLTDNELNQALALLPKSNKIFAISPVSAKAEKNWTSEGYTNLAKHAIENGFEVILLGSNNPSEIALCHKIEQAVDNTKLTNLCGKTSLRVLAAIISKVSLVLSPDSAAMHLASSLKIPVIGLFAIHDPNRVGAFNYRDLEVSVYQECAQKELNGQAPSWRYRVKDKTAMQNILVKDVIQAFDKVVEKFKL